MTSLLDQIQTPDDLKRLSRQQLPQVADEIRQFLLHTIARTGGHLGANLGIVELTLALHYIFNSPTDAFVWDVSHQVYTHKLLTGRRDLFATLRQLDGLSGFAKTAESAHDAFDAGHGGTSISAALGMARARQLQGAPGKVIAIIGDGALTSGMALEALNDAGHSRENLLVVLNDNAMAISPNVGAMARYLNRLRSARRYRHAKFRIKALLQKLPGGHAVVQLLDRWKASIKQLFIPGMLFEDLGFIYFGPVDGHDLPALLDMLQQVQNLSGPVLLHVRTVKGKGYSPAETHHSRLHGVPAFDLETGAPVETQSGETFTEAFGAAACALAEDDARITAISAAMCDGTGLTTFRERFPARCFDVGMAEEHAVTLAAGMAREGLRPIVTIYSTFLQRAYDQILHDICLQNLPVVLALDRAGIVGEDGPTHHGVFDLSYLQMMPNMTIFAPATLEELTAMLAWAARADGPCAIRYPRGKAEIAALGGIESLAERKALVLREGEDVALIAAGALVPRALAAATLLAARGVDAAVVHARFVKPLDAPTLLRVAGRVKRVLTLEENTIVGGFGSAVTALLQSHGLAVPVHPLGIGDAFVGQGPRNVLLARLGLDAAGIVAAAIAALEGRPTPSPSSAQVHKS